VKWSVKLGRFAGIDVFVHATFVLLLVWFGYVSWVSTGTVAGVAAGLSFILSLFLCVVLHEYGHALTARRFGIRTRHITLLPIGGVAMLEAMPSDPRQEILVALAGPAVNFAIAAGLYLVLGVAERPGTLVNLGLGPSALVANLIVANLMLAVFNLLPAFPMDGGRVLRAVLSLRMDRVRATRWAARVGQALAVGLGVLGLLGNPLLILIAVFVWIGAGAEAGAVEAAARPDRLPAGRVMATRFGTLAAGEPLGQAADRAVAGHQTDFPVMDNGKLVGVASRGAILRGQRDLGPETTVASVMERPVTADLRTPIGELLPALRRGGLVCITRGRRLVGIVDLERAAGVLRAAEGP